MVVMEMDLLDELTGICEGKGEEAASLLDEPVPLCLKYWNEWNEGHVMSALREFRSYWSEVREVYLAPPKPTVAAAADPAVAGGMAKGFANSGWRQPKSGRAARPRRAKKITALDEAGKRNMMDHGPYREQIHAAPCPSLWTTRQSNDLSLDTM